MDQVRHIIQGMQIHPVVDHFTIALLFVGVLTDLVGSMAPTRLWIRNMALSLMILGAIAAGSSYLTGDLEADRIWKALGPDAQAILHRHGQMGTYLAITFGVLALWRIFIAAFGFMAGSRPIYLIVAVLAAVTLGYAGHLGGKLVYDYGAGTALMAEQGVAPSAFPSPEASPAAPSVIPTVSVPTAMPTPTPVATMAPPAAATEKAPASPAASPAASGSPGSANM
ncbi:MAG TPA: DUF2231 domain-containing protein [Candidatus Binataceae bacterium]|nr:DUF2231 domain-containing protein [Candidatus Binataceae bacterium]